MTVGTGSAALPLSLYREISRSDWARLAPGMAQPLTAGEIAQIRGLGDRRQERPTTQPTVVDVKE